MKIKPRKVNNKDKVEYLDTLYTAVASLKSREEVKAFLRDLLTESERIMIGRRILIAKMLLENKTYGEIIDRMHVGMDTIMRVHQWLSGKSGGYEKAVAELARAYEKRFKKPGGKISEFGSFGWLKKKYPLHFLLFNLVDHFSRKK